MFMTKRTAGMVRLILVEDLSHDTRSNETQSLQRVPNHVRRVFAPSTNSMVASAAALKMGASACPMIAGKSMMMISKDRAASLNRMPSLGPASNSTGLGGKGPQVITTRFGIDVCFRIPGA